LPVDWRAIAARAGYPVGAKDSITVTLDGGSTQVIRFMLHASGTTLRATSVIARASVVAAASEGSAYEYAWERNRLSDLVGFTSDQHGRLVGEAWIPLDGLAAEEFGLYVSELTRVCDWHEFRLTGENEF
jgi:hypothetical protein